MQINRARKYILNIYNIDVYVLSTMLCLIWPSSQFSMAPDAPPRSVEDRRGAAAGLGRRRGPHACGLRESAPGRGLGETRKHASSALFGPDFIIFHLIFIRFSSKFIEFLLFSDAFGADSEPIRGPPQDLNLLLQKKGGSAAGLILQREALQAPQGAETQELWESLEFTSLTKEEAPLSC